MHLRVAFLAIFALLPASPRSACASSRCTCTFDMPGADTERLTEAKLREASAVFLGTVVRIDTAATGPIVAHFAVERRWKGASAESVAVVVREAPRGPSTCEIDVRLGESYLVFALPRGERELQTHRCDGTTLGALAGNAVSTLTRLGLRVPEG
jgi:hypothetical protein